MFRRLKVLGYPNCDNFDEKDTKQMKHLVLWLEENKIRHYPINEREHLRVTGDDPKWKNAFQKYLKDLDCPVEYFEDGTNTCADQLSWILGYAVKMEYFQKGSEYNHQSTLFMASHDKSAQDPDKKKFSANPLENFDYQSDDFKEGVQRLSQLLKVPHHSDHLITLEACCKLIQKRLNQKSLQNPAKVIPTGEPFQLSSHDMGFGDSVLGNTDPVLKEAAKILRLIHLTNLRELQSSINNTIEEVQRVTANPKTDTKLGKVGY